MDFSGLILLVALLIIGGGLYFASRNTGVVARKLEPPERTDDNYENSKDIYPLVHFPSEPEQEHVPELPAGYNDNNISLMARDPKTMYAYWEVSEDKKKELGDVWQESVPVIRVHDVTGVDYFDGSNANNYHDEIVNENARSWYLHIGDPDRVYCADLGRRLSDGTFLVIARSNYTYTPRNSLSDKVDPEWMLVNENEKKLYTRIGHGDGNSSYNLFDW